VREGVVGESEAGVPGVAGDELVDILRADYVEIVDYLVGAGEGGGRGHWGAPEVAR